MEYTYNILGECLMVSSLPGKALRTPVESLGLLAIQHAFSKSSLVNMISKNVNQAFYLSVSKNSK